MPKNQEPLFLELYSHLDIRIPATNPGSDSSLGLGEEERQELEKLGIRTSGQPTKETRVGFFELQREVSGPQAFNTLMSGNVHSAVFQGEQVESFIKEYTRFFRPSLYLLFLLEAKDGTYCVVNGRIVTTAGIAGNMSLKFYKLNELEKLEAKGFIFIIPKPN